jgi:hypothetical protein
VGQSGQSELHIRGLLRLLISVSVCKTVKKAITPLESAYSTISVRWVTVTNSNGMLTAAYHQHLGDETFAAVGGSLGGLAMGIQSGKLKFDEQFQNGSFDPSNSNGENFLRDNIFQPDLSTGFVL